MKKEKISNSLSDKVTALIIIAVIVAFQIYFIKSNQLNFSYLIDGHTKTTAEIIEKDNESLVYQYFNDFENDYIENERDLRKLNKFRSKEIGEELIIRYANKYPNFVRFEGIDEEPNLFFMSIIAIASILGQLSFLMILLDKMTSKSFSFSDD